MTRIIKRLFFAALVLLTPQLTSAMGTRVIFISGTKALREAISNNRIDRVTELLKMGANPNGREYSWEAPLLSRAAEKNLSAIVKILLQYGANPNQTCELGDTPLRIAIENNSLEIVSALLQYKADPNERRDYLYNAVEKNSVEIVKALLQAGAKISPHDDLLLHAVRNNFIEVAKALLQHGADPNGRGIYYNHLKDAINNNHPEMVKILVSAGANTHEKFDIWGNRPLEEAIGKNYPEVVRALLETDTTLKNNNSDSIEMAINKNYLDVVKVLLQVGANPNHTDVFDNTYLHTATSDNNLPLVKMLVEYKADVNAKNMLGLTPLWIAIRKNYEDVVKTLLQAGADPNGKDGHNNTHLHAATSNNNLPLVKMLVEHKADVNAKNILGYTPRNYATKNGAVDSYLAAHGGQLGALNPYIKAALITIGALAVTYTYYKRYDIADWWYGYDYSLPLHQAARWGRLAVVKDLVADDGIHTTDSNGMTAIQWAIIKNHLDIVAFLAYPGWAHIDDDTVRCVIKNNLRDNSGNTLLHHAVNDVNRMGHFLTLGAHTQINEKNRLNQTPLDLAVMGDSKELVELLIKHGAGLNKNHGEALIFAVKKNMLGFAEQLLQKKIGINASCLQNALGIAVVANNKIFTKILVENGADIDQGILDYTTDPKLLKYLKKYRFFTKNNTLFRNYVITELVNSNSLAAQKNLKILLRRISLRDAQFANRFYDTICANFTEQERKAFGFNYQNVRELYLDLAKYTKQKHWAKKKGWLETCFKLCKGPIFDTSYHGDFESSVRLFVEKKLDKYQQKEIRKDYETNFLLYQNMHELTKPGLKIPKNIDTMPNVIVSRDNSSVQQKFVDMGIKFTKKNQ